MKKKFFIANWKSHKNLEEARQWLEEFSILNLQCSSPAEIVLCPPFPLLSVCDEYIKKHHVSLSLGAQDISPFTEGAYTGAVSGRLIREFGSYVLIGHSERRKYFKETEEELSQKVALAFSFGIMPIYCISRKEEKIPKGVQIVAYEPLGAIGSGIPDNPETTESTAGFIKQENDVLYVLYGGSISAKNVTEYTDLASINGVLVGGASLSPEEFTKIINHA